MGMDYRYGDYLEVGEAGMPGVPGVPSGWSLTVYYTYRSLSGFIIGHLFSLFASYLLILEAEIMYKYMKLKKAWLVSWLVGVLRLVSI